MMLSDVRDFIESLKLADYVYMSKMPDKKEKSFGVYNSKHQNEYHLSTGHGKVDQHQIRKAQHLLFTLPVIILKNGR